MRLTHYNGIVYVLKPGDHQAGVDGDSFKLTNHKHATFLIQFAALTGDAVLTIYEGATAGTKTTAKTFNYRLADAAQGAATGDTFGDETTSAALTLTAATYQNKMLVVELGADALTQGLPWVTLEFSAAASALNASVAAVLSEARYPGESQPTAIA